MALALPVSADHQADCVPGRADPSTTNVIDLPDGRRFYIEERNVSAPLDTQPPVPFTGFAVGQGTWIYEETNALEGLQRGGVIPNPIGPETSHPLSWDRLHDQNCGHGSDRLVF